MEFGHLCQEAPPSAVRPVRVTYPTDTSRSKSVTGQKCQLLARVHRRRRAALIRHQRTRVISGSEPYQRGLHRSATGEQRRAAVTLEPGVTERRTGPRDVRLRRGAVKAHTKGRITASRGREF